MGKTRRDFLKVAGAAALGAGTVMTSPRKVHAQTKPTFKWKATTLWSAAELTYKVFSDFCARVKKLTDGRLEITPFPAGAIVGTFECLDALSKNVLQAMNQWPGYWTGKDPAFASIGDMIFAYNHPWEKDAWYHYKGGLQMLRDLYAKYNAYCVGVTWWGVESIPSKKPLRKIEDFKGLKFRVPQGMTADLMTKLGASVIILPGGEVYSALERGVVDATDWGTPSMNYRLGFHEVTKYFNYPGFHSMPDGDFVVNMDEWKKLPEDIKVILEAAVREYSWDSVERVAIDDIRTIAEMKKKGVTPIAWSEEELRRIREVVVTIWDEWAAKSPLSKKIIDSQKAWLRDLGRIK
jgi:TRAP-type mannitol/chloroaromatic compound transport system substrate-binding protein